MLKKCCHQLTLVKSSKPPKSPQDCGEYLFPCTTGNPYAWWWWWVTSSRCWNCKVFTTSSCDRGLKETFWHFSSPDAPNMLLKITAVSIMRDIAVKLSNSVFLTLMADEVTDASNNEQVAMWLRSTDENLDVHEDFISLHVVESTQADVLVSVLKMYCCGWTFPWTIVVGSAMTMLWT